MSKRDLELQKQDQHLEEIHTIVKQMDQQVRNISEEIQTHTT